MKVVALASVALGACAFSAKLNGNSLGGSSGAGTPGSGVGQSGTATGAYRAVAMPDLTGKTPAQALELLRAAGIVVASADENVDDLCGEGPNHEMTPQGASCKQVPMPGADANANGVRLRYTMEHDAYEYGGVGGPSPWRRMPDVTGKPLAEATTILARAQLPVAEHFEVIEVRDDACAAATVCEQSPLPRIRKALARRGRLYVGAARAPSTVDAPSQTPASSPPAAATQPSASPDTYF